MYTKFISLVLSFLLLSTMNFAFVDGDDEEKAAELKANARELLRETTSMALALNSPTNRITFTIRLADILWDIDETDARGMFSTSIDDIKRLLTQLDIETNRKSQTRGTRWSNRGSSRRTRTEQGKVFSLRSSLINSLANHDPEWAMRLLNETTQAVTNQVLIKRVERDNKRLEAQIIRKIAAKDVTKALELAKEKLAKGVTSEVVSLLSQIYEKDPEKGADFAGDVLQKLKASTLTDNQSWLIIRLFQYGMSSNKSDKTPLFDESGLNDLGDLIAKQIAKPSSRYRSLSSRVMSGLEKYSPSSASQIKRVFEQRKTSHSRRPGVRTETSSGNFSGVNSEKMRDERSKFQTNLAEGLRSLGDENKTSEERQKMLDEAKDKIMSVDDDGYKFNALISLASQATVIGEKDSAISILDAAESFIKQDPKERRDFSNSRSLANAYALVDADRAFNILETMIYRLNGVINGYIKFMEFSGNGRIVENDELLMNRRSRQFTNYLNFSPGALKSLAESDYTRLKALTDKFERPEIRIDTRLLIAKGLLNIASPRESSKKIKTSAGVSILE